MGEDIKREKTQQTVSDEELDEISGGCGIGGKIVRLPYTSTKKPTAKHLPCQSGEKPKATLL